MKNRKFIACILGCVIVTWITLAGKMSGDVATALSVVIGGFYGANAAIEKFVRAGKVVDP